MLVPDESLLATRRGPGSRASVTAAAAMPATICVGKIKRPRSGFIAPTRTSPRVTCGRESVVSQ